MQISRGRCICLASLVATVALFASIAMAHAAWAGAENLAAHPGELLLDGSITSRAGANHLFGLAVASVTGPNGITTQFITPRSKNIGVDDTTRIHVRGDTGRPVPLSMLTSGMLAVVVGKDTGPGKDMLAREIAVWTSLDSTHFVFNPPMSSPAWGHTEQIAAPVQTAGDAILAAANAVPPAMEHPMLVIQEVKSARNMMASADDKTMAIENGDGSVQIWTPGSRWIRFNLLEQYQHSPQAQAWRGLSPDGHTVGIADSTGISLWNTVTGRRSSRIDLSTQIWRRSAAFSPDSMKLAVQLHDLTLFSVDGGEAVVSMHAGVDPGGPIVFSPDGQSVLSCYTDGVARLWKVDNGQATGSIRCTSNQSISAQFSPDGKLVAIGCEILSQTMGSPRTGYKVSVYDVATQTTRCSFDYALYGWAKGVQFSPDSHLLVAAVPTIGNSPFQGVPSAIQVWDTTTGKVVSQDANSRIIDAAWSPDSADLYLLGYNTCQKINPQTGKLMDQMSTLPGFLDGHILRNGQGVVGIATSRALVNGDFDSDTFRELIRPTLSVGTLEASPNGKFLAVPIPSRGTTFIWNQQVGNLVTTVETAQPVVYSDDSSMIAVVNLDGSVSIRRFQGDGIETIGAAQLTGPTLLAFSHNDKMLALVADRAINLYETGTGALKQTIAIPGRVNGLAFSPEDLSMAVISTSGPENDYRNSQQLQLWDLATATVRTTITLSMNNRIDYTTTRKMSFSPDGQHVVAFGSVGNFSVYDLKSGQPVPMNRGYYQGANVTFSPDGRLMALYGHHSLQVFETKAFTLVLSTYGDAPQFSVDSKFLYARIPGQGVVAWDVTQFRRILDPQTLKGLQWILNPLQWQQNGGAVLVSSQSDSLVASLIFLDGLPDPAWIMLTPDGYFDCSDNAAPLLKWNVDGKLYPFEAYSIPFRKPDKVKKALQDGAAVVPTAAVMGTGVF